MQLRAVLQLNELYVLNNWCLLSPFHQLPMVPIKIYYVPFLSSDGFGLFICS